MAVFRIVYEIVPGADVSIELRGEIERPTLREALDEFFDECGDMLKYKEPSDFDIEQLMPDLTWAKVALCPECDAGGYCEGCEACGGTGQATAHEGLQV